MNQSFVLFTEEFIQVLKNKYMPLAVDFHPSQKKIMTAYEHYGLSREQKIIALIDCTVFGSAKNGAVIVEEGFYWKNDWTTESTKTALTWSEIIRMPPKYSSTLGDKKIYFSENILFGMAGSSVKPFTAYALLEDIVQEYQNQRTAPSQQTRLSVQPVASEEQCENTKNVQSREKVKKRTDIPTSIKHDFFTAILNNDMERVEFFLSVDLDTEMRNEK